MTKNPNITCASCTSILMKAPWNIPPCFKIAFDLCQSPLSRIVIFTIFTIFTSAMDPVTITSDIVTSLITFHFQQAEPIYILILGFAVTFFLGTFYMCSWLILETFWKPASLELFQSNLLFSIFTLQQLRSLKKASKYCQILWNFGTLSQESINYSPSIQELY